MKYSFPHLSPACFLIAVCATAAWGQAQLATRGVVTETPTEYRLGPDDQIKVWAMGVDEITKDPYRIDPSGYVDLPIVGRIEAGGHTVNEFRGLLIKALSKGVRNPQVSVDLVEFGSQPVSVLGAVKNPGVHQLNGRKTLAEVLSLAGGLADNAGPYVKIVRPLNRGTLPLSSATVDPTGNFSVVEIRLKEFMDATAPATNVLVQPNDLITVPKAQTIYVMGEVRKPGGFAMSDRLKISALQALALAEGAQTTAAPQNAKILRFAEGANRQEIPINLKKVLQGKAEDIGLQPDDILVIPDNTSKKVALRAIEAAVQTATGVAIWRVP